MGVSKTFQYSGGSDQQFKQTDYVVAPTEMDEEKLTYDPENDKHHFPLVILMQSREDRGMSILVVMVMYCNIYCDCVQQNPALNKHR